MDPRNIWSPIRLDIDIVSAKAQGIKAARTNAKGFIECVKKLVQDYFYTYRSAIIEKGIDVESIDLLMQDLFKLTNSRSSTKKYKSLIKTLKKQISTLETESLLLLSKKETEQTVNYTNIEIVILETLEKMIPEIAISYNQVLYDLVDPNRISFRGSAAEIREVLRGVLEALAPDSEVEKMTGFKFEKDVSRPGKFLTGPTMKQKVRFILKSRGKSSGSMKAPKDAVSIVEELVSNFTRSIYTRGSVATHTDEGSGKKELQQLKMYVDTVLCELLEIQF
jgi:Predicted pPIWI-associating nuclease